MSDLQTGDCGNNSNVRCTFNPLKWEAKNTHLFMLARRPSGGPDPIHLITVMSGIKSRGLPYLLRVVFQSGKGDQHLRYLPV